MSTVPNLPPPPVGNDVSGASYRDWFYKAYQYLKQPINLANITGILGIANGGTATSDVPANGELLIGNGTDYTVATLTAGANVTITNGVGSITIASSGGGGGLYNIDGGVADSIYNPPANIDGGVA